jgi:acylphosphatase
MRKRVHIFYSGKVQGVGFRMTAEDTAQGLGIVGWVKNLRDGRVELMVEGEEATLRRFLQAIRSGAMKNFIQQEDISWGNASDTFDEFEIRYY